MRDDFNDILAFMAVARARGFTRAAAQLGRSQSSISQAVKLVESRLGVKLLARTTRNVTATEAGQQLIDRLAPEFEQIEKEMEALRDFRDTPTGTIRITAIDYAIRNILWPKVSAFLQSYPAVKVELISEYESVDIAARGYDAGVRFGEALAQDMISVRIGPDVRNVVVGAKSYFANRRIPQVPQDLAEHACINLRMSTHGGLYEWEFIKGPRRQSMRVDGPLVFNNAYDILQACREGFGLAYLPRDMVEDDIEAGRLVTSLELWCPTWEGFHLYYPSRRQTSRAMALLIESLRVSV